MRISSIAIISILCAGGAAAQEKVTVPISNPSQPITIKANMTNSSIRVTAGTGRDLIVSSGESTPERRSGRRDDGAPAGMKRIGARPGLEIEEDHNVVTISSGGFTGGNVVIETPVNTNLQLRTTNGDVIEVTGVNGDHEIVSTNGSVQLRNVSGSVVAYSQNGQVVVSLDRITSNKPMSFTAMNGRIDVTLPADTKARLRLRSDNGAIYSDFDVKMEPDSSRPVVEDSRSSNGKYRISMDKAVTGTINGGGPEYTFRSMNGSILIHKK